MVTYYGEVRAVGGAVLNFCLHYASTPFTPILGSVWYRHSFVLVGILNGAARVYRCFLTDHAA